MMKKNLFVTLAVATLAGAMLMGCASNAAETKEVVETEADVTVEDEEAPLSDAVEDDADADADADAEVDADADAEVDEEAAAFDTVEAFYTDEANKANLDASLAAMVEAVSDYYSNIEFNVTGNEVEYVYTLAEGLELSADDLQAQMDATMTDEYVEQTYALIEAECGVAPEKIAYTYLDANGEEIISLEY